MLPEIASYLALLDDQRRQVIDLLVDVPAEALNWRPLPDLDVHVTNSLAVLATHIAGAERFWIAETIGGYPPTRDRDAEFRTEVTVPDPLVLRLKAAGEETRAVLATLTAERLEDTVRVHDREAPVRWSILHVIDHSAVHLGHMQITYQLWMGGTSRPTPRWFERLPAP